MTGLIVEFCLVAATFLYLWRREVRARQRLRQRAAQLDFDFARDERARD